MIGFTVIGVPSTQGSKTARPFRRANGTLGVAVQEGASKAKAEELKTWRSMIATAASLALQETRAAILDGPVIIAATFYLPRPKNAKKKLFPDTRPDLDKLQRAIGDALSGVAYTDDSRIVDWNPRKRFADNWDHGRPGVAITVRAATEADL